MGMLKLTKDSIDIGIVVCDAEKSLAFYRDLLGFELTGEMAVPGGGTMYRLLCGTTTVKLVALSASLPKAAPGGLMGACGYRYCTIKVSNLHEIADTCAEAGYVVAVKPTVIRPGVTICMVEDPDGNWIEFLQEA